VACSNGLDTAGFWWIIPADADHDDFLEIVIWH
jgi:hypothetical protein